MARVVSVVFWVAAVIFGLLFVMVTFTKLTAGDAFGYLIMVMVMFGIGCGACVVAARRPVRASDHLNVRARP